MIRMLASVLVLSATAASAAEPTFLQRVARTSEAVAEAAGKTHERLNAAEAKVPGWEAFDPNGAYDVRRSQAFDRDGGRVYYEGLFNPKTNNWVVGRGRVIPVPRKAGEVRVKEHGPRKNGVRCLAVDVFGQQARWHYVTVTRAIEAVNRGREPRVPVYEATADTEPEARRAAYAACTDGKAPYGSTCMVFCDGAAGSIRTRMFGTTAP
jgi:hypothetical protein